MIAGIIAFTGWYFLSGSPSSTEVLTSETAPAPDGSGDLIHSLVTLRAVSLSGTIFSNPSFQVLQDFTTPIVPEPVGRPDPFATLGSENAAPATVTSAKPPALH